MRSEPQPVTGLAGRAKSLDGLRGVAAVVVLIHHALLTYPVLASKYVGGHPQPGLEWLTYTPLHLLWAGNEAVMVFFLLSGIVLTLPVLRSSRFIWRAYYPSRLIRLYLPVAASVALAAVLIVLVPRASLADQGAWLALHAAPPSKASILHDLTLVAGAGYLNSPLWSLQYEVLFSLLLPLYVLIAARAERAWWVVGLLALGVSAVGSRINFGLLEYLPLFLLGALVAARQPVFARGAQRLNRMRGGAWVWTAVLVVALTGLVFRWLVPRARGFWVLGVVEISAVALVLVAIYWRPASSLLETRTVQWLGAISFSLYLVHEPILVTVATLFPSAPWAVPAIGVPLSFGAAWLFGRFVERPAHRLSQRVRKAIEARDSSVRQDFIPVIAEKD